MSSSVPETSIPSDNPIISPEPSSTAVRPQIWFPKEEDLWVPGEGGDGSQTTKVTSLGQYMLDRIADTGSHTAFAAYDTLVSVNPQVANEAAKVGAESSFNQLWTKIRADPRATQSVLIVGDSGSGKTVAFETFVSHAPLPQQAEAGATATAIGSWLKHAQTILSAFGCAPMSRNANSSRYVNVLRLGLDAQCMVISVEINPTLLEKSRVTHRNAQEGNFHILRNLAGITPEVLRSELNLHLEEDQAEPVAGPSHHELWTALTFFNIAAESQEARELLQILAAIRSLGRLKFTGHADAENNEHALVKTGSLEEVAGFLGVSFEALQLCLCQRRIMAGGHRSIHEGNLTVPLAEMCRDVLAKEVYESCFLWLVDRMNAQAFKSEEVPPVIKSLLVVDAFGFENLDANDNKVEQLCVNYVNDLVYGRYFRREVLLREKAAYGAEGLAWDISSSQIPDNDLALDLVGRKNTGLLALLDEQTRLGAIGSDAGYLCETRGMWLKSNHPCFAKPRFNEDSGYVVKHFVSPVTYTVQDFIDRACEGVHKTYADFYALLQGSSLSVMMRALQLPQLQNIGSRHMGERVVSQTAALQALLDESERIHFILCLRSSTSGNGPIELPLIERQVQNFKINESAHARRLPVHVTFEAFGQNLEDVFRALGVSGQYSPSVCLYVLNSALPTSKWSVGHSQIFLAADARRVLLSKELSIELDLATRIQSYYRMWKCWRAYRQELAARRIESIWRGFTTRRGVNAKVKAVVQLQSAMRMWRDKAVVAKTRTDYTEASIKIEAHFRKIAAMRERAKRLASVIKIQAAWRRYIVKSTFDQILLGRMHVNSLVANPFLKADEAVVLAGVVLKKPRGLALSSWHRRVLVLTTAPRLMYIDPAKSELRGELHYGAEARAVQLSENEFELITPDRTYKFKTLMKPNAALWCHVLQNPTATPNLQFLAAAAKTNNFRESIRRLSIKDFGKDIADLMNNNNKAQEEAALVNSKQVKTRTMLRNVAWKEGREIKVGQLMHQQGYLLKFEEGFFGKWSRRYVLIQENKLSWFARSIDTEAVGTIELNQSVIMRDTESTRKHSFTIESTKKNDEKMMIRLQAFSPEQKKNWLDAICKVTGAEPFPYYY